ncbi:hypothetical protein L1987_53112 [Smallanthus sonchifolius]|uniref:Uncharacterized protein n=1 Tax=Smallanthus sonchifolius TaxID=185202 RepID=A0ACB9EW73_9ASTR|nr:hypothetical protein L1987_53112 [Smallanthus sonchifolius]
MGRIDLTVEQKNVSATALEHEQEDAKKLGMEICFFFYNSVDFAACSRVHLCFEVFIQNCGVTPVSDYSFVSNP